MKCTVLLLGFVLALVSCSNKEDHELTTDYWNKNDSIRVVTASDGTFLKITKSTWFTTTTNSNSFGQVNLAITGSTNADRVTVLTSGDGVIDEQNILLDTEKNFKQDTIGISFTHFTGTPPTTEFERSTVVKAYKGADTLTIKLNSGKLRY